MRTNMTTLTQTWMTLLLNNILPRDHNSNLPLPKCQLVYVILTRMSVHVAQLIADVIYLFVGMPPTRHPLDLDKSNRALGFPSLIIFGNIGCTTLRRRHVTYHYWVHRMCLQKA